MKQLSNSTRNIFVSLFLATSIFGLTACSDSSSDKGKGTGDKGKYSDEDFNPHSRWPATGDFSYEYETRINGRTCTTKEQRFNNMADYCMALTDQELNSNCALDIRKITYQRECGDDFQVRNFNSPSYSGYDNWLSRYCEPVYSQKLRNTNHLCQFLSDEQLHKSCFWADRKADFDRNECQGQFSQKPSQSSPIPSSTTTTTTTSTSTTTTTLPEADPFQNLRSAGIEVTTDSHQVCDRGGAIGRPNYRNALKNFIENLPEYENLFIRKKQIIKTLNLMCFTSYTGSNARLNFDVTRMTDTASINTYLQLLERRVILEKEVTLNFDFGPESIETLGAKLNSLNTVKAELKHLSSLFQTVELKSYTGPFFSSQKLMLNEKNIEQDIRKLFYSTKEIAGFATQAKRMNIDFRIETSSSPNKITYLDMRDLANNLNRDLQKIVALRRAGLIQKFTLVEYLDTARQQDNFKELKLGIKQSASSFSILFWPALIRTKEAEQNSGTRLDMRSVFDINNGFIKFADVYHASSRQIGEKRSLIENVTMSGSSTAYYRGLKLLSIGQNDSVTDVTRVLNGL